jgi:segregation and condensation protein B
MNEQELTQSIEALLFAFSRPFSRDELSRLLDVEVTDINAAIATLATRFNERGMALVDDGKVVELRTAPVAAETIERIRKEEFSRDIGRAGLEALAAILYRGPLSRSEIDFIRGVNSSQTLRTLLTRGLIRKVPNPKDERSFLYEGTTELYAELGLTTRADLPDFVTVRQKLADLETSYKEQS